MAKQANRTMIGGFVVIAVGILAVCIVIFGSGDIFKKSFEYVLYFEESVKGLNVGSPVLYQGFPVGQVKRVVIQADLKDVKDYIQVFVEVYPESVVVVTEDKKFDAWKDRLSDLISLGLRAQLVPQSLVTGKLAIELNEHPDKPAVLKNIDPNYEEIPTIPSTLSKIESALGNLDLEKLSASLISVLASADRILQNPEITASISEFKGTLVDARKLVNNVDQEIKPLSGKAQSTLDDVGKLARNVDGKVDPLSKSVTETLKSVNTAFKSIDDLVGKRSPTRAEIDNTLREIQKAARSVRLLADYLEQHPEALLKGKGSGKY